MGRNRARGTLGVLLLGSALAGCPKRVESEARLSSDEATLYLARRVLTLAPPPSLPTAEALLVRGGKVAAVGSRAALVAEMTETVRLVDLGEATLVPGLVDAHGHLLSYGRSLSILELSARSLADLYAKLNRVPATSFQGDWLVGRGWDQNDWPEQERDFPTRARLDELFPTTPVYLTRIDGHAAWVNGEALRRAKVSAKTADPPGGRILRNARGEPTGVFVDNAMDLFEGVLPPPTEVQREEWLKAALERLARAGLVAVHDAGMDLATFQLLQQWDLAERLPLRVYGMVDGQGKDVPRFLELGPYQGRLLTLRAVKFLMDGALGSRGAALGAPYADAPLEQGLLMLTPDELVERASVFMERGFQVAVHAIGDRANRLVMDALAQAAERTKTRGGRHRLEHAQVLAPEDIPRLAALGWIASMQPVHATSDMPWAERRLGRERLRGAYAWKSLGKAGVPLAFGSDFPVEDPNPLAGLYAARTRQDPAGNPEGGWFPEERLNGEEALRAFTAGAAYASFGEQTRGELSVGKDADFTALSVDPLSDPPAQLLRGRALLTVVAGREVFRTEEVH